MNSVHRPVMLLAPVLFIFLSFAWIDVVAGVNSWTTDGPEGAAIWSIAVAAKETATVYAATSGAGVFRSKERNSKTTSRLYWPRS